jgi:kynurenine formamidase
MNIKISGKTSLLFSSLFAFSTLVQAESNIFNQYDVHDLTHLAPLYEALEGDSTQWDINQPLGNSQPVAGSGGRLGVRTTKPEMQLPNGTLRWGYVFLEEHYSTHVDSTDHFVLTNESLSNLTERDVRDVSQFTLEELIGPIVYIDVSDRVNKELAKNGGKPSIDLKLTNFNDETGISVMASDIDAVADQLVDGAYLVVNVGWEGFYIGPVPQSGVNWEHPYNNNLNHPGVSREATDRLIEIENKRGIRIAGIVVDNIAVESGHSIRGDMGTDKVIMPQLEMYMHAVGLQRGWKLVENAANLGALNNYGPGQCDLVIGAPRLAGASGSPSRLIAVCKKQ